MKKILLATVIVLLFGFTCYAQIKVSNLLTENLQNPIDISTIQPRFSWQITSAKRNVMQTAYEIKLMQGKQTLWSSGKVNSDSSVHIVYKGNTLQSEKKYQWQVRVWDNYNEASNWSEPASFQTALLNSSDWKAKWIEPGYVEDSVMRPSPLFRKEFSSNKKITNAVAHITAHGLYEAYINGEKIGDAFLTPGWTSYHNRLQYQTYDVTNLIKNGSNAIAVMLGNGWYRGIIGFNDNINVYGKDIALLLQLDVTYSDGSTQTIISDGSWKTSTGEIRYTEIYNGETIDATKEKTGWKLPGYNDKDWNSVKLANFDMNNLITTVNEPVKKHETFKQLELKRKNPNLAI